MNIIFVEYPIHPERRTAYLEQIEQQFRHYSNVKLYEGTDQPNKFVEQWMNTTKEDYEQMKRVRLEEQNEWDQIATYIPGGKSRLHIWEFMLVSLKGQAVSQSE